MPNPRREWWHEALDGHDRTESPERPFLFAGRRSEFSVGLLRRLWRLYSIFGSASFGLILAAHFAGDGDWLPILEGLQERVICPYR